MQARKQLLGSVKTAAARKANGKDMKDKLAHLEKQVATMTRENRQLGSKVSQLGFLLSQSYVASQGRKISKINIDGNEGAPSSARGGIMGLPPGPPPDRSIGRSKKWGKMRTSHTQAAAVNAVAFGSSTTASDSVDPIPAVMPAERNRHQQQRPASARLASQEPVKTQGQAKPHPPLAI